MQRASMTAGSRSVVDGTEICVRRPDAGHKDRGRFTFGKNKQNAVESVIVADGQGHMLWCR
ncbi:hypothetical protein AAHZ94_03215 [Streptomyces sp. HSW2009]|uniref:hypothetical protein n=1 Tax=Streptomyces sp. HSW2009 TaxID=3142890 RepID=UPI0032EDF5DD